MAKLVKQSASYLAGDVIIRSLDVDDAPLLAALSETTFYDAFYSHPANRPEDMAAYMAAAFSEEQIGRELANEKNIFLLAEIDGEAAGYAKLIVDATEQDIKAERPIELSRLYVHQRFLGEGIGQLLMDECLRLAKDLGHDVMWLGVWEHNPRAKRFYEKNEFQYVGTHIFQLGSDSQTDLLMQRHI